MPNCESCGNSLKFFENVKTIWAAKRCNVCVERFTNTCVYWQNTIQTHFNQQGVSHDLEVAMLRGLQDAQVPADMSHDVVQRLHYLRNLSEIRYGNVPVIHAPMHLDSDEHAHFTMAASYHKPTKNVKIVRGQMIGTNKKLYFQSSTGADSHIIDWNNVARVDEKMVVTVLTEKTKQNGKIYTQTKRVNERGVQVTVTKGSGGGEYVVIDPLYTKTLIDTLVRMWKRQLVFLIENKVHGAVPDHVKSAVLQRDQGRCVQCGSDADGGKYLEYDHIHPRSKGGQNTVENIQLLCRMCNLKKGARV